MTNTSAIHIASAIITDASGRCLLVRKRGTSHFIQPGGKIEPSELPAAALSRELQEELGLKTEAGNLFYVGKFTDVAINEPGREVVADIYHIRTDITDFQPAAEIEQVLWYSPEDVASVLLAPLTENHLLPLVKTLSSAGGNPK